MTSTYDASGPGGRHPSDDALLELATGTTSPAGSEAAHHHLDHCSACSARYERIKQDQHDVAALLGDYGPAGHIPESVARSLQEAIAAAADETPGSPALPDTPPDQPATPPTGPGWLRTHGLTLAASVAALLLVVAGGLALTSDPGSDVVAESASEESDLLVEDGQSETAAQGGSRSTDAPAPLTPESVDDDGIGDLPPLPPDLLDQAIALAGNPVPSEDPTCGTDLADDLDATVIAATDVAAWTGEPSYLVVVAQADQDQGWLVPGCDSVAADAVAASALP